MSTEVKRGKAREEFLPYSLEIDGDRFTRMARSGNYKVAYESMEDHEIAFFPNSQQFSQPEKRSLQVAVWRHNGEKYNEAGLKTADQRFDENGKLMESDSGYETGVVEVHGERYPFLKSYHNPHIESIESLYERPKILNEKVDDIVDAVITLDQLKREGTIATAESVVDWEEILEDVPVVTEKPLQFENGNKLPEAEYPYHEKPEGMGEYLMEDFIEALYNDTTVRERWNKIQRRSPS